MSKIEQKIQRGFTLLILLISIIFMFWAYQQVYVPLREMFSFSTTLTIIVNAIPLVFMGTITYILYKKVKKQ